MNKGFQPISPLNQNVFIDSGKESLKNLFIRIPGTWLMFLRHRLWPEDNFLFQANPRANRSLPIRRS